MCERRTSNKCVDETSNVDEMCEECLDEYLGRNYGCEYPDDIPDERSTEDWYREDENDMPGGFN